jgi:hypothetical protein
MTALPFRLDQAVKARNSFLSDGAQAPVALVQSFGCGFAALERGFDPREQVRHLHVPLAITHDVFSHGPKSSKPSRLVLAAS